jgi:hypothetical protein
MQEINKEADETGRRNAIKINKMKAKEKSGRNEINV